MALASNHEIFHLEKHNILEELITNRFFLLYDGWNVCKVFLYFLGGNSFVAGSNCR